MLKAFGLRKKIIFIVLILSGLFLSFNVSAQDKIVRIEISYIGYNDYITPTLIITNDTNTYTTVFRKFYYVSMKTLELLQNTLKPYPAKTDTNERNNFDRLFQITLMINKEIKQKFILKGVTENDKFFDSFISILENNYNKYNLIDELNERKQL